MADRGRRADLRALVAAVVPSDAVEEQHRTAVLGWLDSTADVYRRVAPRTPPQHLVAYVVPYDPEADALLLVDHRRSGLWLPAGGHVEPDEDPAAAACREAREELGLDTDVAAIAPSFLTVTETVGPPATRHVDVSLWYLVRRTSAWSPTLDERELRGARWWTRPEVLEADPARFDPHLGRFLTKIGPSGL